MWNKKSPHNESSTVANEKKSELFDFIQIHIKRCLAKDFWKELGLNEIFAPIPQPNLFFFSM